LIRNAQEGEKGFNPDPEHQGHHINQTNHSSDEKAGSALFFASITH
jgi:hypothetical protein